MAPGFLAWVWRVGGQDPRGMVDGQHQPEVKKHAILCCEYSPNQLLTTVGPLYEISAHYANGLSIIVT